MSAIEAKELWPLLGRLQPYQVVADSCRSNGAIDPFRSYSFPGSGHRGDVDCAVKTSDATYSLPDLRIRFFPARRSPRCPRRSSRLNRFLFAGEAKSWTHFPSL